MKIKRVLARSFKGGSFVNELGPVTIITGDNFARKTAIPTAIRLALAGFLPPPIGKTAGSIYKLASNSDSEGQMSVAVEFDNGRSHALLFEKDKKGRVSMKGAVPSDIAMPALFLEPSQFFALTNQERVKAVMAACDPKKVNITKDALVEALQQVEVMPARVKEQGLGIVADIIEKHMGRTDIELMTAIDYILKDMDDKRKEAVAEQKRASGAFAAFKPNTGPRPKNVAEELKAKRATRDDVIQGCGELFHMEQEKKRLEQECAKPISVPMWGKLALEEVQPYLDKVLKPKVAEVEAATQTKVEQPEELFLKRDDLTERIGSLEESIAGHRDKLEEALGALGWTQEHGDCPYCAQAMGADYKAKRVKELTAIVETEQVAIGKEQSELARLNEQMTQLEKQIATEQAAFTSYTQNAQELPQLKERLQALETQLTERAELQAKLQTATEALDGMKSLAESRDIVTQQVNALEEQQQEWIAYEQTMKRKDELEQAVLTNDALVETYKQAIAKVTAEIKSKTEVAFNEILEVASKFTDGILNSPLEFCDGELGRRVSKLDNEQGNNAQPGAWVSHECFSGTEQLVSYAAFSVAICMTAPVKVVIMDELGRITHERKAKLISRMEQLVEQNVIDQFIGIDVAGTDYADDSRVTILTV